MLKQLQTCKQAIGNTPLMELENEHFHLFAKLEFLNYSGSVKIRPAYEILSSAIQRGELERGMTVIESSSGNFALALATLCRKIGVPFVPVIDPNINLSYEKQLHTLVRRMEKVTGDTGNKGYLASRLASIDRLREELTDTYWPNQYDNKDNIRSHYEGIGEELANAFTSLDYAFLGVGSCGTLAGVSTRLKEKFPNICIIAVDVQGSAIFGDSPAKRLIPGIGSTIVPANLGQAQVDEVIRVAECDTVKGCQALLEQHGLFVGGSSGSAYHAIQEFIKRQPSSRVKPNAVFLCADHGTAYLDTVYNPQWVARQYGEKITT